MFQPWFYYVGRAIIISFLHLTHWQVKGRENVPSQGPVLIVANHIHLADPPILGVSFGRKVIFMAKKQLFRFRPIGYLIRCLGAFPVHRGQLDRKALHQTELLLAQGQALLIFPEGMRSKTGQLQAAFPGSALIACRSGAPILPVAISGTEKLKGVAWLLRRPRITVNIGYPFYLPPINSKLTKVQRTELTNAIMQRIADLLPPQYRGIYAGQGKEKK